ncbi:alpha-amylase family glycosyl hydrolase [Terrimonas sp. NA20]|uniref:1,4-alpha-glucan branching enzyme n=1 Tax=Terrimonas ginsenosidimutans TaxID=2908004 RepID=A0ABS9KY69_9BACT|nr:alpha-amylase family glycosyl hydrolase [Terrimonas ginsenosidimutans]MCG2617270.1 alpha-amylase family glycosyl hydrolase [Terrimonas ginsenosidimutans]
MQTATKSTSTPRSNVSVQGMGSILHKEGVFFRVWAPHATQVFVTGDFNEWSPDTAEMQHEDNGYWAINIPEAKHGQTYKYVLETDAGRLFRNDPYAKEVAGAAGNSVITTPDFNWEDEGFQMPDWNKLVIYELHVGTFNRKEQDKPGTFFDVIEKLDYLRDLGVNALEIMPPVEFPGAVSWGYNPSHPFAIESEYGGINGFKTLINEAHKRGIAIILDIVYNHFGPDDLDLWRFDGWSENDGGGIYFYQDHRRKTPWGDSRPDFGRDEVRQYIRDNAMMWLDEFKVDGLRTDAISFIRNVNGDDDQSNDIPEGWSLMQWINKEIAERFPWKITIAEDMKCNEWITRDWQDGGEGFDTQWDAAFVHPVRRVLSAPDDQERNMEDLAKAITYSYNNDTWQRVIYTESHDEVANGKTRVLDEISPGESHNWFARKRSTLGAVLIFTSPGIPMIFQGQEMLEDGWFSDTRPVDWNKGGTFEGIVKLYRDLIQLRTNQYGLTKGLTGRQTKILYTNEEDNIIAFSRTDQGGSKDTTVVVINFANKEQKDLIIPFPEAGLWKIRFNSDWKGYDAEFHDSFAYDTETLHPEADEEGNFNARVDLAPYNAIIYSMD